MFKILACLTDNHDWHLITLAVVVCFLASCVAISLFQRATATKGYARLAWLSLDAFAAGYGIWATHFIAVLAYDPGIGSGYNVTLTILSLLLAILITGAGLSVALRNPSNQSAVVGGAIVGSGIAAMHYTGMLAFEFPGQVIWSLELVISSAAFGVGFGACSLFIAIKGDDWNRTLIAAGLFTVAIIGTHFTGMSAVTLMPDPSHALDPLSMSPTSLSLVIAGVAIIVLTICLVVALSDRQSKDNLRQQKVLLDTALENMVQGLCMYEADGRTKLFNERYVKMMGLPATLLQNLSFVDLLKRRKASGDFLEDPEEFAARVIAEMREGKSSSKIIESLSGRTLRVAEQPMSGGGWIATFEDITAWREAQAQISHMAHHDALTNLPNRTLFREKLDGSLRNVSRNEQVAVLCVDLDSFKDVNDSLGHPIGDELLKEVSQRLSSCLREGDSVSRLGGDEFAIVQVGKELQVSKASALASRIVETVGAPYIVEGHHITIGASIGISVAPYDGTNPDQLLKNADLALYRAKADGRATFRFFEIGMDARAQARRILELELREALPRREFEIHYQPIHDLKSNKIISFEALLRWNHPLRGLIQPADFIPLAEETGLILPIGEWVLQTACEHAAEWPRDIHVAINLSPAQFKSRNLVNFVREVLSASGLDAGRLELEITESVLLQDNELNLDTLHKFRDLGIRISMDDFGTGYCSLSYLRSFPFDKIKIDRSFVHELATRGDSMAIVRAVTGLGKSLGIATTAEGVETNEQLNLLRAEGCDEVQGYLFSPARPLAEVELMLADDRTRFIA